MDSWIDDVASVGKIGMKLNKFIKTLFISLLMVCMITISTAPSAKCAPSIEQKQKQAREKIDKLRALEKIEKSKLVKNQLKLENAHSNLQESKSQFDDVQGQLSSLEQQLNSSIVDFNNTDAQLKYRIRQVFKSQRTGMFQLILSAKDLNGLLDIVYFERIIIKQDYQRLISLRVKAQKIAKLKKDVETKKVLLSQSIQTMNSQQKNIQKAIAQNHNMINQLKTNRAYYERTERELARQSENLQNMISKNSHSSASVASGGFMRPISGRITSPFGWRVHPIFNSRTFHSGIDIGGPNMGSIRASNSGKIIYAGWYGGYGKVVIIDHGVVGGKPITTLYAHMSQTKAGVGQSVSKGQIIGYEGTTGYSTGPHCHFEVRINGKPSNPLSYI